MTARRYAPLLLTAALLAGCGGDSAEEKRVRAAELREAEARAANEARLEERQLQQQREQAKLRREVNRLKRERRERRPSTGGSPSAPAPSPSGGSCGGGISAGANTSCAFARNVRNAYYRAGGGNRTVQVYSPTTGRTYSMSCDSGSPHVCSGGNNASVLFE